MKCNSKLIYYKKLTKKGERKLHTPLPSHFDVNEWGKYLHNKTLSKLDLENTPICGGKIVAKIDCKEQPGYGGDNIYVELCVEFVCQSCKQNYHSELPHGQEDLNKWLTEMIEKL